MFCSNCKAENPDGLKFCNECGAAFKSPCASCGFENVPAAKFCGQCGATLAAPASGKPTRSEGAPIRVAETPDAETLEGERKTVTALFADIKGSTELEQDLDPEEARAIIDPALKLMIDSVRRYDGYIVQSTGDGIFALFGAPVAREDHPQRALYSAIRMQEELKRYSVRLVADGGSPLQCRVGINTGEVVVRSISTGAGQTEYTPIGHTTNLASRMQAVAPVGSIAVAEPTRKLVEGYFALKALGPTKVKGVSEPVNVYEVTGLGPLRTRLQRSAGRGLSKFVGRDREMAAMEAAGERAKAGHGQIVAAMAEAGTGKSRLFFEFKVKNQSGSMVLETFSVSHGKASAFLPVLDLLHGYFKISSEDDARARREKIGGKVLMLDRAQEDTLPYLFALLGIVEGDDPFAQMDPQVRKRRTLDAIKRILLRESLNQPLMVVFEDLHWIDDETQALLNLLAESIANAKILLLVNYRPEYSHQWNSKTYYTQLRLDPLGKESADEMLAALLGDGAEMAQLKHLIIERTEGNPFFMEETVQVLLDEGTLVRDGAAVKLTKALADLKIPPTVQAILAARIDRLPADEKDLLRTLAVMGKEFQLSLVRAVSAKSDDELNRMLGNLQLAEFIYEQPAVGDIEYSFKHALTQEVSYNSVLVERRRPIHDRVAEAIESIFAQSIESHLGELAHHYSRGSNSRKAVEFLGRAGVQAANRSAYTEARAYLSKGLALLDRLRDDSERAKSEMVLQAAMGRLLMAIAGASGPEVERSHLRVLELSARVGDWAQHIAALFGLRLQYILTGDLIRAKSVGDEMLILAEREGNSNQIAAAHFAIASTLMVMGDFQAAVTHGEYALAGPEFAGTSELFGANPKSVVGFVLAQSLCCLGFPDRARRVASESLSAAQAGSTPFAKILAIVYDAEFQFILRDAKQCLAESDSVIEMCLETGAESQLGRAMALRAWALTVTGRLEEGITQLQRSILATEAAGVALVVAAHCSLAQALGAAGKPEEGLEAAQRGFDLMASTGEREHAAELYRLKGELTLLRNRRAFDAAETSFREAIAVAREQRAKWMELRSKVSLARLLRDTNRRDEARAILAEIYNWFTEGFDTADLKDAKALLDELSN